MTVELIPGEATLSELEQNSRSDLAVSLSTNARAKIDKSASLVQATASGSHAVYGINTGFGKLANVKIDPADTEKLQRNLILFHCCGVGESLDISTTRLMMVLKLLSLGRGASGVRWEVIEQIQNMLAAGITPVVPGQGSVRASGDLAPLAHMTAAMIGEGSVFYKDKRIPAREALLAAGLSPLTLSAKEGLGLINGTQFSTACALVGLFGAWRHAAATIISASLPTDAIMGSARLKQVRDTQNNLAPNFGANL